MDRKEYMQEYQKEWKLKNPGKQSQYSTKCNNKRKESDPLYYTKKIFRERKRAAEKRGIPFDITIEDIMDIPTHCPILGIELKSGGRNNPNAPSLDRLIPEKGYVKGNVYWISFRANRIKCDATREEVEKLLTWMQANDIRPS